MPAIPMHAETTDDPHVMRWIVRGQVVGGSSVLTGPESSLPEVWNTQLTSGAVAEVTVSPGCLAVRVPDSDAWATLAPLLNTTLREHLNSGKTINVGGASRSDSELAEAVARVLDGPLHDYVASHGGQIELDSVVDGVVTVRLIGACRGCPSAGTTLRDGIEAQLRTAFPDIVGVRSVEGARRTPTGRKTLPIVS